MRIKNALFSLTLFLLLSAQCIDACICNIRPPVCYEYWRTEAIFVGTVREVQRSEDTFVENVGVEINESFLGMSLKKARTYNYGHSCAFNFQPGLTFLFYAGLDKEKLGDFGTSFCTRTSSDNQASFSDDLKYLRAVKEGKSLFWIWGTISYWGYDEPLSGIRAEVIGATPKIIGTSNQSGDIKLEVSKPGKYRVRIYLPPGRTDINALGQNDEKLWYEQRQQIVGGRPNGKNPYVDYEVIVQANRCGWFDISIPGKPSQ
jgi:hypothetical protein